MKSLLNPLRQIGSDLVRKRLWPIALALVAGVIALIALGGSGEDASPLTAQVPVTAPAPAAPGAAATIERAAEATDAGTHVRNPFFNPPKQPAASSGAATSSSSSATASGSTAARSGQASADRPERTVTTPARSATVPAAAGAGGSATSVYYRTVVRWRRSGPSRPRAIARLTPLGGRSEPAALFLGVARSDGRYAIFALGPNATTRASRHCADPSNCRMIGLRAGETQLITVRPPSGGVRHYRLRIAAIRSVRSSSRHARVMRGKVHAAGRGVLRAFWRNPATVPVVSRVSYSRALGLLSETDSETSVTKPVN